MGSLAQGADISQKRWNVLVTGFGVRKTPDAGRLDALSHTVSPSLTTRSILRISLQPVFHLRIPCQIFRPYIYIPIRTPWMYAMIQSVNSFQNFYLPLALPRLEVALRITFRSQPPALARAPGRKYFSIESCANRDGYVKKDIYGKTLEGDTYWHDAYDAPPTLHPSFDIQDLWTRWTQSLPNEGLNLRMSDVAGRYLCEFIFYAAMLEYWRRSPTGDNRHCMFMHVPPGVHEDEIERGRTIVLALIVAMVQGASSRQETHDAQVDDPRSYGRSRVAPRLERPRRIASEKYTLDELQYE
ncbi:uncharacterized protein KY384_002509 [Bacidia gigantensis]|uniref:uncharacterized protein n=1 Tax=Bacidia gigantensis TaxID=2732470 RepID=UPI001D056C30|nr:uncharacterized protein KY384_002509 [Bacidia gigantensis]KAG8532632.1 hypothetical protein KY384_002509 [Bacidia gigantensis]